MRRLIALIIVMSLLIVLGFGALVYGLVTKTGSRFTEAPPLVLPSHSKVQHMSGDSSGIALYVTGTDGDKIYFVDPKKGLRGTMAVKR